MRVRVSEVEIGGKTRGFKFGTYQLGVTCKAEGCDIVEVLRRLENPEQNLLTILNFLYGAAVAYNESKRLPVDFTPPDVSDWLDEIGLSEGMKLIKEGMASPNKEAPQSAGPES